MGFQGSYYLSYFRRFLPNGDINADEIATFLADYGIQYNGRFPGRPVTDDKFTLTPPKASPGQKARMSLICRLDREGRSEDEALDAAKKVLRGLMGYANQPY